MAKKRRKKPPPRLRRVTGSPPPSTSSRPGPIREPAPESGSDPQWPVVARRELDGVIYQFEYVICGKPRCHCARSRPGHGPYWYSYHLRRSGGGLASRGGRWVSRYVGTDRDKLAALGLPS